ncbi:MAG: dienelactone hydrolase [Deltaproteobacteria bacterium]|nr:dienelactone hydrolase [Deltaproteobacteria bacterium]
MLVSVLATAVRCVLFALAAAVALSAAARAEYDPLALANGAAGPALELTTRDGSREIPLRVYTPAKLSAPAPIVLYSHGLGGSRNNNRYLGEHWSARGYVAVFMQHPGSDESVWKDLPREERMEAMREAATPSNAMKRAADVEATLDALAEWPAAPGHALAGKLDVTRVGMSGHSFGAVTTQLVSGQRAPLVGARFTDARIYAALAMSPSKPRRGSAREAFGAVKIPWLLMTGTHDGARIGGQTPASRLEVFPALPNGSKYELVLDGAEHDAFGDRALPGEAKPRNPNHHRAVLALSTAFWDAYLRGDQAARAWLDGDAARSVLDARDRWQRK